MALTTLAWASNPQVKAYGKTYGEWSAQWWQWVHSIPAGINPLLDATGEHCDEGQFAFDNDKVWFLAGTTGGEAERHCTVPHGKALLYPLVNGLFHLSPVVYGAWTGATIHDLPQLIAAAQQGGGSVALKAALFVKLVRVAFIVVLVFFLSKRALARRIPLAQRHGVR